MARILVVEDSPDIRVLVRMLLEAGGHEVTTASDGRTGVETTRLERPDLVLMDLSLPILSGWEATKEIKEHPDTAAIPVVAVTAHAMHGDRERALAAGCDGFIPKPIDEETFEPLVRSYLRPAPQESSPPAPGEPAPEIKPAADKAVLALTGRSLAAIDLGLADLAGLDQRVHAHLGQVVPIPVHAGPETRGLEPIFAAILLVVVLAGRLHRLGDRLSLRRASEANGRNDSDKQFHAIGIHQHGLPACSSVR